MVVPAWTKKLENGKFCEAVLDVEAVDIELGPKHVFDITVRNPLAKRYRKQIPVAGTHGSAITLDSFSCLIAQAEKRKRYPDTDNLQVKTMAVEVFGRIGDEMLGHLQSLATAAGRHDRAFGRPIVRWLTRWTTASSFAVARGIANSIENSAVARSVVAQ